MTAYTAIAIIASRCAVKLQRMALMRSHSLPPPTVSRFRYTHIKNRRQLTEHIILRPLPSTRIAYVAAATAAASLPLIATNHVTA